MGSSVSKHYEEFQMLTLDNVKYRKKNSCLHGCISGFFGRCPCRPSFKYLISFESTLSRYQEDPPIAVDRLLETLDQNIFLMTILEVLNETYSRFYFTVLPSGSIRERFGKIKPSTSVLATDYDLMLIPDGVKVGEAGNTETTFQAIEHDGVEDGFVWLQLNHEDLEQWKKKDISYPRRIRNEQEEWFDIGTRHQQGKTWPPLDVIQKMVKLGCHLVPKPTSLRLTKMALNQEEDTMFAQNSSLEWRYSFSQAEMILSEAVPEDARTAYLALKALVKKHVNCDRFILPSFVLKCIFYRRLEVSDLDAFPHGSHTITHAPQAVVINRGAELGDSSAHCTAGGSIPMHEIRQTNRPRRGGGSDAQQFFEGLLDDILEALENKHCPNLWIPQINLMKNFTSKEFSYFIFRLKIIRKRVRDFLLDNELEFERVLHYCCKCWSSFEVDLPDDKFYKIPEDEKGCPIPCCPFASRIGNPNESIRRYNGQVAKVY